MSDLYILEYVGSYTGGTLIISAESIDDARSLMLEKHDAEGSTRAPNWNNDCWWETNYSHWMDINSPEVDIPTGTKGRHSAVLPVFLERQKEGSAISEWGYLLCVDIIEDVNRPRGVISDTYHSG